LSSEQLNIEASESGALFADVVLPLPLQKLYTYRLPSEFFELAVEGKRVFVPFGNRKVYTGIIVRLSTQAPQNYEALNIISVIDDNPIIDHKQLDFWKWVAEYYMCGLGDVMSAALPAGLKMASESFIALQDDLFYNESDLDEREVKILEALKGKEKVRISELETVLKSKSSLVKIVKSLYERQFIVMFEDVSETYKPKKVTRIKVKDNLSDSEIEAFVNELEKKAKNQYQAFLVLLSQPNKDGVKLDLIKKFDLQSAALKALTDKGYLEQYQVETSRFLNREIVEKSYTLSDDQSKAFSNIIDYFNQNKNVLLYGATSSGKTFIYIELIKSALKKGKSVLYLIPEIALTEQLIQRLELYFGSEMMVSHSRFSKDEKVEIWNKVKSGEVKLLLGSRSSLFMPLKNLGLIIIDEEHEPAFKQHEKAPRYHARDAALVLAKSAGARVLMGSATPSIETYQNALLGKYGLVALPEMFGKALKTKIVFADIKEETKEKTMSGVFTEQLMNRLRHLQEEKSQAILFQNRKGYVPMLECSTCGWVSKCVNCDIALTYYKYSNNLRCHYCGFSQSNISKCQACANNTMTIQGFGTERITEDLQNLMPELRIMRFDQDSTKQKNAFRNLLNDFEAGAADVMVGTQIAVKGLDYGNVQLTSVINADHLLNFPDFRSHERTFQLLHQLSGRAGRQGRQGEMIIQTRQVDHPVLQFIANNDYLGFYNQQIVEREQFNYAPFSKMIKLTLKHKSADEIQVATAEFAKLLKQQLGSIVLGPETPYVSKIRNQYIRNLLLKIDPEKSNPKTIKSFIVKTFDYLILRDNIKGLQLLVDVDPQ
jgi:primosomal protein N' (replication factor Y)